VFKDSDYWLRDDAACSKGGDEGGLSGSEHIWKGFGLNDVHPLHYDPSGEENPKSISGGKTT